MSVKPEMAFDFLLGSCIGERREVRSEARIWR